MWKTNGTNRTTASNVPPNNAGNAGNNRSANNDDSPARLDRLNLIHPIFREVLRGLTSEPTAKRRFGARSAYGPDKELRVVQPWVVRGARLDDEFSAREKRGNLRSLVRARGQVQLPREHQDQRVELGQHLAHRGRIVECAWTGIGVGGLLVVAVLAGGGVGLRGCVPAAVAEAVQQPQVVIGRLPGHRPLEGGHRLLVPGLAAAQRERFAPSLDRELDPGRPGPGGHQHQRPDPLGIPTGVKQRKVAGGGVGQHVHPLQPKVSPERFDVVHLPANKNIGTTHIANGAYRLHPVEWSIGEAAGALAAYCLDSGRTPAQVRRDDVRRFQDLLSGALGVPLAWPEEIRRHSPE
ncbi:hypothetical protein C1J01_00010 [Nonomuraea aridisoli]|uniref:FAD-dependent oxidoreductase n=1 Tax=Nonomuraea aridisoli TaxID=2070368 RepID=A0A2W2EH59_9ACTN|nr:hypothetical protein C1J01_00010 [Nonomuraea aridisoli]